MSEHSASGRREQTRERILSAALELFAAEGTDGLSMRRLAERTDYSPATLYKYFHNKEDIIVAMRERFFEGLVARMRTILEEGRDLLTQLRQGCRAYVEIALANPELYAISFNISVIDEKNVGLDLQKDAGTFRGNAFLMLREKIERLMAEGTIAPGDPHQAAFSIWAGGHGLASLLICLPMFPGINREEIVDRHIEIMICGLKSRPGPSN